MPRKGCIHNWWGLGRARARMGRHGGGRSAGSALHTRGRAAWGVEARGM
jgi:hypothetical protein